MILDWSMVPVMVLLPAGLLLKPKTGGGFGSLSPWSVSPLGPGTGALLSGDCSHRLGPVALPATFFLLDPTHPKWKRCSQAILPAAASSFPPFVISPLVVSPLVVSPLVVSPLVVSPLVVSTLVRSPLVPPQLAHHHRPRHHHHHRWDDHRMRHRHPQPRRCQRCSPRHQWPVFLLPHQVSVFCCSRAALVLVILVSE